MKRVHETNKYRQVFGVVGDLGAVHFWIEENPGLSAFGGIEIHSRKPPEWREDKPPDNESCWLLNGPCWHDGSSLQAHEFWIPLYKQIGNSEGLWLALEREYASRFPKETADAG